MPKLRIKTKESGILMKEEYLQDGASNGYEKHVYITLLLMPSSIKHRDF